LGLLIGTIEGDPGNQQQTKPDSDDVYRWTEMAGDMVEDILRKHK